MIKKTLTVFFILFAAAAFLVAIRPAPPVRIKHENVINKLQQEAKEKSINLENIRVSWNNNLEAHFHGINIIFSANREIEKQVASLQKIAKSFTIEKKPAVIDFRFHKIVLSYD